MVPITNMKTARRLAQGFSEAITRKLTKNNKLLLAVAGIILILLIIFKNVLIALLAVPFLFCLGVFSVYYKRKLEGFSAVGFELVTFASVITGAAYGPIVGAIFGLASSVASVIVSRDIGPTTVVYFMASALVGALAQPIYASFGILAAGMMLLAVSTVLVQAFTFFVQSDTELKILVAIGIITNFAVNYIFFAFLGKPIMALIA